MRMMKLPATPDQLRDAMDRLVRRQALMGKDECHQQCLTLIDDVARYITETVGEIPDTCLKHLMRATHASSTLDIPVFVHQLDGGLLAFEVWQRAPSRQHRPKPLSQHTDKLLDALKHKKAPTS